MATRDWIFAGIGLTVGFFIFSVLGKSLIKSAYHLTAGEVKALERKAKARAERLEKGDKG